MNSTTIEKILITIYTICYIIFLKELYLLWDNLCYTDKRHTLYFIWIIIFFISSGITIHNNYKEHKSDIYVMIFTVILCCLFFSFFAVFISPILLYFVPINLYFLISNFYKKFVK